MASSNKVRSGAESNGQGKEMGKMEVEKKMAKYIQSPEWLILFQAKFLL